MCVEGHQTQWRLKLVIDIIATGNLLAAAGILFTGNTFTRTKEFCNLISLSIAKMSSLFWKSRKNIFPLS